MDHYRNYEVEITVSGGIGSYTIPSCYVVDFLAFNTVVSGGYTVDLTYTALGRSWRHDIRERANQHSHGNELAIDHHRV